MLGQPTGFWGKLERDADGAVRSWHPLADHCLDVACVTEALLTTSVLGARMAHLAGRDSLGPSDVARLAVLAALHDIGKFNHGFQAKAEPGAGARAGGHVGPGAAQLWAIDPMSPVWGIDALGPLLAWADDAHVVRHLLLASVGHHGRPVAIGAAQGDWRPRPELDPIAGVVALVARCRETFPAAFDGTAVPLPADAGFQHAFAGLVMLADWLGSDAGRWFPYSETADRDHGVVGRRQARAAVAAIGLDVESVRRGLQAQWSAILPTGGQPRALQAAAADLEVVAEGGVEVFEAETGAGKTEAALLRFAQLFAAGAVDGLYFALPTRTAATQLHGRIQAAADRLWGVSAPEVVLAVPGYLQAGAHTGQQLPGYRVLWPDDPSAARDGRRWAAEGPKRFLCATIAVGTIDQVLLAGLEVNHAHLRATALMRSYLVVDEVHASDAYMTTILRRVLRFHVAAGGHALLLSATLGEAMRSSLAAPLRLQGARSLGDAMAVPYPALHVGTATTAIASDGRDKAVTMELCAAAEDPARIAALAGAAARAGAHVLVIRNLVSDAVATQRALEAELAASPELMLQVDGNAALHHSRFATADRTVLDTAIERAFGKGRPVAGKVAVATQKIGRAHV